MTWTTVLLFILPIVEMISPRHHAQLLLVEIDI
jgi:hypothetical protein